MLSASSSLYSSSFGYEAMMSWYEQSLQRTQIEYEPVRVPTRFGETHLVAAGPRDAPPVVLLHGMEGNAASWRHQLVDLHTDFRTYALDIVGSAGKSAPVRLAYHNAEHGQWLADVLDALRIERAHLVGISNGSWLIFKVAGYAPERIASATLMSPNGFVPVRFPYSLARLIDMPAIRAVKDFAASALTRDMVRRAVGGTYVADVNQDAGEIDWFYLLAKYYRFRFPPGPAADDELRALVAPTLVLMGEHEQFFPHDAVHTRARSLLSNLTAFEVISGVGHNMCTDDPKRINARVRAFLSDTSQGGSPLVAPGA